MRRSLHVGINDYPGTQNDLSGCANDAEDLAAFFRSIGFQKVRMLINGDATVDNYLNELVDMFSASVPGDVVVVSSSSHGTPVVDWDQDEPDGYDEAICFHDGDLVDDRIRELIAGEELGGVHVVFLIDSCFSGTVTRAAIRAGVLRGHSRNKRARYMPPKDDGKAVMVQTLKRRQRFLQEEGMVEVLMSAASDQQYAWDDYIDGRFNGAFTSTLLNCLRTNSNITYNELYNCVRQYLPSDQYPQTPQLEGRQRMKAHRIFTPIVTPPQPSSSSAPDPSLSSSSSASPQPPSDGGGWSCRCWRAVKRWQARRRRGH